MIRIIRIHLTTGPQAAEHDQTIRTGFIQRFVFSVWLSWVHANSLVKSARIAWPCSVA